MEKRLQLRFYSMFFIYFAFVALFWGFALPIYVRVLGLSDVQKGFVLAIVSLSSVFGNLMGGHLSDKFGSIKKVHIAYTLLFVFFASILFIEKPLILGYLNVMLIGMFSLPSSSLLENWAIEYSSYSKDLFGPIRGFGSLGWAIMNTFIGNLYARLGFEVVPYFLLAGIIIYLPFAITMEDAPKHLSSEDTHVEKRRIRDALSPQLILLISVVVLINMSFFMYNNVMVIKFNFLDPVTVAKYLGYYYAIGAASEFVMFMYSRLVVRKIKGSTLLATAAIGMSIVPLIAMMIDIPRFLIWVAVFNLVTFAPFMVGSRRMVDDLAKGHLRTTTQTFSLASQTFFVTIGLLSIGFVTESFGINAMYPVLSAIGATAAVLIMIYRKKYVH